MMLNNKIRRNGRSVLLNEYHSLTTTHKQLGDPFVKRQRGSPDDQNPLASRNSRYAHTNVQTHDH